MQQAIAHIRQSLEQHYPATEIESFIRLILQAVCGFTLTDYLLHKNSILPDTQRKKIEEITQRLQKSEPIQYILGYASFMDFTFQVSPGVLIPRPETEELVELIRNRHTGSRCRILDIGTGSGCIAVSLARLLPECSVEAWDISPEALECAEKNAVRLNTNIRFRQADILSPHLTLPHEPFDILVSNPPYVCHSEKRTMAPNVLDYEPEKALFVPDRDPLLFYRAIATAPLLKSGGNLYVEINARFGRETAVMLSDLGFREIEIIRDLAGKDRIVTAVYH